uniref:apolipoprotein L6-like n=1 Tax=Jaculus jaculus TaxID=51337 RepID=UPI001E1B4F87|nr:apolipoprotein L6-like [Jaculus jaculus]
MAPEQQGTHTIPAPNGRPAADTVLDAETTARAECPSMPAGAALQAPTSSLFSHTPCLTELAAVLKCYDDIDSGTCLLAAGLQSHFLAGDVLFVYLNIFIRISENHLTRKDVDWEREKMPGKQAATECKAGGDAKRGKKCNTQGEDMELQDGDLSAEEREFLEQFSKWKKDQEVAIKQLYALAEDIDANHKKMVKSNVVTSSAAVASGVMSLLGLALAPATLGASTMLTVAGSGLGAAAGVTRIVTDVWETYRNRKAQAQASTLLPTTDQELEDTGGKKTSYVTNIGQIIHNCGSAVDTIRKHTRALRLARAHPHLATSARRLMTTGQVSTRSARQVQKAFTGTALAMTKEALLWRGLMSIGFLCSNIAALSEEWKQLKEGTRAELAEELRAYARELEELVGECTQYYKQLRNKKMLHERKQMQGLRRWLSG